MDKGCSKAFKELVNIINKNYYRHNPQFRKELLRALKERTGNNNVGILCEYIIDNLCRGQKGIQNSGKVNPKTTKQELLSRILDSR